MLYKTEHIQIQQLSYEDLLIRLKARTINVPWFQTQSRANQDMQHVLNVQYTTCAEYLIYWHPPQTRGGAEEANLSLKMRLWRWPYRWDLMNTSTSCPLEENECKWRLPCLRWDWIKWQLISMYLVWGALIEDIVLGNVDSILIVVVDLWFGGPSYLLSAIGAIEA